MRAWQEPSDRSEECAASADEVWQLRALLATVQARPPNRTKRPAGGERSPGADVAEGLGMGCRYSAAW